MALLIFQRAISWHLQKCAIRPRREGLPATAQPPAARDCCTIVGAEPPTRQGLWNGRIKNDCGNEVLLATWNSGVLSRARRSIADGYRQMYAEKGSKGQELVTVWDGGQLEGDTSSTQSEWQGTRTLQPKHLDEFYLPHHLENCLPFLG